MRHNDPHALICHIIMNNKLEFSKQNDFFLAIGKQNEHSFIMLGVIKDNSPYILARMGKTSYNIDPDLEKPCKTLGKLIGKGTLAILGNESFVIDKNKPINIAYQAYAINYDQTKEFLSLIRDIDQKQRQYYNGCDLVKLKVQPKKINFDAIKKHIGQRNAVIAIGMGLYYANYRERTLTLLQKNNHNDNYQSLLNECPNMISAATKQQRQNIRILKKQDKSVKHPIQALVPTLEKEDEQVTFEFKRPKESQLLPLPEHSDNAIIQGVQKLQVSNTCRTSALNIVEKILGFKTDVSRKFFIAPRYKTTLTGRQFKNNICYAFPPPPTVYQKNLSKKQLDVLNKLYKRMKSLPTSKAEDPKTRDKFNALKTTYRTIAGENQLNAAQLLEKIIQHENTNNTALFIKRGFFGDSVRSTTQKLFDAIKKDLEREKKKSEKLNNL